MYIFILVVIACDVDISNTDDEYGDYDGKDVNNQVSCKCNAAMYWVNMPGMDEGNNPVPGIL